ncbi:MAG: sensor histidine kinase [Bifidobacterium dentium]
MTLLAQSCNVLLLSLTVLRDTSEPRAVIAVLVMQIAATVAGYALRRHRLDDTAREQRLRLRTTQERIAILERNMRLARRLHDDLTNNLASIGMLCEAHLLSCSDPDERLLLTSIRDKTRESVSCAHEVIDTLRGKPTGSRLLYETGRVGQTIRGLVEARQAELRRHGFEGSASVTIDPDAVLPMAVADEIVSLLAEVYSNIRAHASPTDGGFSLELAVSDDGIRLVQMNMCRPDDRTVSGRGLQLHRHIIATLGGTLSTSLEDDVWTLKAHIPKAFPASVNAKRQAKAFILAPRSECSSKSWSQ